MQKFFFTMCNEIGYTSTYSCNKTHVSRRIIFKGIVFFLILNIVETDSVLKNLKFLKYRIEYVHGQYQVNEIIPTLHFLLYKFF